MVKRFTQVDNAMATTMWLDHFAPVDPSNLEEAPSAFPHTGPKTPYIQPTETNLQPVPPHPSLDVRPGEMTSGLRPSKSTEVDTNKSTDAGCSRKECNPAPTKMERARPKLVALMICLTYITTAFLTLNISAQAIRGHLESRIYQANAQMDAATDLASQEKLLYSQLEDVLNHPLSMHFMESHEQCLARGLEFANKQFLGIDFTQYPDARNQTMDWTTENCGRIFHTPRISGDSPQERAIMYWVKATYTLRQYALRALTRVKKRVSLIRMWFVRDEKRHSLIESSESNSGLNNAPRRFDMPFGFKAVCYPLHPCELVYQSDRIPAASAVDPAEITAYNERAITRFRNLDEGFHVFMFVNSCFVLILLSFGAVFTTTYMISLFSKPASSKALQSLSRPYTRFTDDERYLFGSFVVQFAVTLVHSQLFNFVSKDSRILLPLGLVLFVLGTNELLSFHISDDEPEHIGKLIRACKDLGRIVFGLECSSSLPAVSMPATVVQVSEDTNAGSPCDQGDAPTKLEPASKVGARFVSPVTTFYEDIEAELETLRAEQAEHAEHWRSRFQLHYDTSDDTDDEVFVDLGCSQLPTVSEKRGGWSVVDN